MNTSYQKVLQFTVLISLCCFTYLIYRHVPDTYSNKMISSLNTDLFDYLNLHSTVPLNDVDHDDINFFKTHIPLVKPHKNQVIVLGLGRSGIDSIVSYLRHASLDDTDIIVSSVDALDQIYSANSRNMFSSFINVDHVDVTVPVADVIYDSSDISALVKVYPNAKFISISRSDVDEWFDDYSSNIADVQSTLQMFMNAKLPLHAKLAWSRIYGSEEPSELEWKSGYQQYYNTIQKSVPQAKLLKLTYEDLTKTSPKLCTHLGLPVIRCADIAIQALEAVDLTELEESVKKATYYQLQSRFRRPFGHDTTKKPKMEQYSSFAFVTALPSVSDEADLKAAMIWCQSIRMTSSASPDFDIVLLIGEATNAYESIASYCFDHVYAIDPTDIPPFSTDITQSLMMVTLGMTSYYRVVYMDYTEFVPMNRHVDKLFIREHYVSLFSSSIPSKKLNFDMILENSPQLFLASINSESDDSSLQINVSPSSVEPRTQVWIDMVYLAQTSSHRQIAIWGATTFVESTMVNTTLSALVNNADLMVSKTRGVETDSLGIEGENSRYPTDQRLGSLSIGLLSQYSSVTSRDDTKRLNLIRYDNLLQDDLLGSAVKHDIDQLEKSFKDVINNSLLNQIIDIENAIVSRFPKPPQMNFDTEEDVQKKSRRVQVGRLRAVYPPTDPSIEPWQLPLRYGGLAAQVKNRKDAAKLGLAAYIAPYGSPYGAPYGGPYSPPYRAPYGGPYAPPGYRAPYGGPYSAPYSPPYKAPYSGPYTPPYSGPYTPPYTPPYIPPYTPPVYLPPSPTKLPSLTPSYAPIAAAVTQCVSFTQVTGTVPVSIITTGRTGSQNTYVYALPADCPVVCAICTAGCLFTSSSGYNGIGLPLYTLAYNNSLSGHQGSWIGLSSNASSCIVGGGVGAVTGSIIVVSGMLGTYSIVTGTQVSSSGCSCGFWNFATNSPTKVPILLPSSPTSSPSVSPSSPTLVPSFLPSLAPFSSSVPYVCPAYTATNTNSATQNYVTCSFQVCEGYGISISACGSATATGTCGTLTDTVTDTYIRLFDASGTQVAVNDDSCYLCSALAYSPVLGSGCQVYSLRQGCYLADTCTAQFTIVLLTPSAAPTIIPTVIPSQKPTFPTSIPTSKPTTPTSQPSSQPSRQPSRQPSSRPSGHPTSIPTSCPSISQTPTFPTSIPTLIPTLLPSSKPSILLTKAPSVVPTYSPSTIPTQKPTSPTLIPSSKPTTPSSQPSSQPSRQPTSQPSSQPIVHPSAQPSSQPFGHPSTQPSGQPSRQPSVQPSRQPSSQPSSQPSRQPSSQPISHSSMQPSGQPSRQPSVQPSRQPSSQPSSQPSRQPSTQPTGQPSRQPSGQPSRQPSNQPTARPSASPTFTKRPPFRPTTEPSIIPTYHRAYQSNNVTQIAANAGVVLPVMTSGGTPRTFYYALQSNCPTICTLCSAGCLFTTSSGYIGKGNPSASLLYSTGVVGSWISLSSTVSNGCTVGGGVGAVTGSLVTIQGLYGIYSPSTGTSVSATGSACGSWSIVMPFTLSPTGNPSTMPSLQPIYPTGQPSSQPSGQPFGHPSSQPSGQPSVIPSNIPTSVPTHARLLTLIPSTKNPSSSPSLNPTYTTISPTIQQSIKPTSEPSSEPSMEPTITPSLVPSITPSFEPSFEPTSQQPSRTPSYEPSNLPTFTPSTVIPLISPSSLPSVTPTTPSSQPTSSPTSYPSAIPTLSPSSTPTSQPSSKPSGKPSNSPSYHPSRSTRVPTYVPTSLTPSALPFSMPNITPTMIPASTPTSVLTLLPTNVPTLSPTSAPSYKPFASPSIVPSSSPSCRPTVNPTSTPSYTPICGPMLKPTLVPSASPSIVPSSLPSTWPTATPSSMPSYTPIYGPTLTPTVVPSASPSIVPTSLPSCLPTVSPTSTPSYTPICGPTLKPTVVPSASPSIVPSSLPSTWPTATPSSMPSYTPICGPTLKPTVVPSASPSIVPSSLPSTWPTATPSSMPSYTPNCAPTQRPTNSPTLKPTTLPTAVPSRFPSLTPSVVPTNKPSSKPSVIPTIGPSAGPTIQPSFSPTITPSSSPSTIMPTSAPTFIPHAPLISISNITATGNSITLFVNISNAGTVYCAAFKPGIMLTSPIDVISHGQSVSTQSGALVQIVLLGLQASTIYYTYCYTQDFNSHSMSFANVLSTRQNISTGCCRSLLFSSFTSQIPSYIAPSVSSNVLTDFQFSFSLDSLPASNVEVQLVATPINCNSSQNHGAVLFYPSSFKFSVNSLSLRSSFLIRGDAPGGCFNITAFDKSYQYANVTSVLTILSPDTVPQPPQLLSAELSNDGRQLVVSFDSPTDEGISTNLMYNSVFNCSNVLFFDGASTSHCIWTSNTQVTATLSATSTASPSSQSSRKLWRTIYKHNSYTSSSVYGAVSIRPNRIKALCKASQVCAFAVSQASVVVVPPLIPISPVVSLSAPNQISACDNLQIDPTSSTGSAGRDWSSVQWTVSATGYLNFQQIALDVSALQLFLQPFVSIDFPIVIPNSFLQPGVYTFFLSLTNFLGQNSIGSATITISAAPLPTVTINGPKNAILNRSQPLFLLTSTSLPACVSAVSTTYSYKWSVYDGETYLPSLISESKDPSMFKLSPYVLQLAHVYKVVVEVSSSNSALSPSNAHVTVQLQSSGVQAVVAGGSSRVFGAKQTIVLDASASIDLNYPVSPSVGLSSQPGVALFYSWTCSQIYPSFGSACPGFESTNTSIFTVLSSKLLSTSISTTVVLTVFVTNSGGLTSSVPVRVQVVDSSVPSVSIGSVAAAYSIGSTILIPATVNTEYAASLAWSCSSFNLDSVNIALTPVSKNIGVGFTSFPLALLSQSLTAGKTYVFQLTATYLGTNASSYSQVNVFINAPPVNGVLIVSPSTGQALTTSFSFQTSQWSAGASSFPLSYVFSYRISPSLPSIVIKNADVRSFSSALLAAGLASLNYSVVCYVNVTDAFGGTASAYTTITVNPFHNTSNVAHLATQGIEKALQAGDSSQISQVIGAVSSTLNTKNCTVTTPCAQLNRLPCSLTARTCGACISGYVGVFGDSNTQCVKSCGGVSTSSSSVQKTCPHECSGHGTCVFVNNNFAIIPSCSSTDSFCKPQCQCQVDYYGNDCSLTLAAYTQSLNARESLCFGLASTVHIQDLSDDVIISRTSAIAGILADATQISHTALFNCTYALLHTVSENPKLAGQSHLFGPVIDSLSHVLEVGNALPNNLVNEITSTIAVLTRGIHHGMVIGMSQTWYSRNVRYSTYSFDDSILSLSTFSAQQNSIEKCINSPSSSVFLSPSGSSKASSIDMAASSTSSSSSSKVAIVQYNFNPQSSNTLTASMGVSIESLSQLFGTFQMPTLYPVSFNTTVTPQSGSVACKATPLGRPYNVSVYCYHNTTSYVECDGLANTHHSYQCPQVHIVPVCTRWNGTEFTIDKSLTPVAYSSHGITCQGPIGSLTNTTDDDSYRLSSFDQFSSSSVLIKNQLVDTIASVQDVTIEKIQSNPIILVTMSTLLALLIIGFIYLINLDIHEATKYNVLQREDPNSKFDSALKESVPVQFQYRRWTTRFWNKLLVDHDLLVSLSSYRGQADYRAAKWLFLFSFIFNVMFVDTLLAQLYFTDYGRCSKYTTASSCTSALSLDTIDTLCTWNSSSKTCSFNSNIGNDLLPSLIWSLFLLLGTVPLNIILALAIRESRMLVCSYLIKTTKITFVVGTDARLSGENPMTPYNNRRATGDRLLLLQESSVDDEAEALKTFIESESRTLADRMENALNPNASATSTSSTPPAQPVHRPSRRRSSIRDSLNINQMMMTMLRLQREPAENKASHAVVTTSIPELKELITDARTVSEQIVRDMMPMQNDAEREVYLLQRFVVHTLSAYRKYIAASMFQLNPKLDFRGFKPTFYSYFCAVAVPTYFLFVTLFVFLFGLSIGPGQSSIWLFMVFLSLFQDILVMKPFISWYKAVIVSGMIQESVKQVYIELGKKAVAIMHRQRAPSNAKEVMEHRIQHLNPACRAAAVYPDLPISMLIMAIRDSDIPFILIKSDQKQSRSILHRLSIFFNMIMFQITIVSYIMLANFAATAQDIIIQVMIICGFGLAFVGVVVLGQQEAIVAALLSGIGFLLIVALVLWETYSPGDNLSDVQVEEERLTTMVREMSFSSRQRVAQELLQQPSERLQTSLETVITFPGFTRHQSAQERRRLSPIPQSYSPTINSPTTEPTTANSTVITVPAREVLPRRPSTTPVSISLSGDDSEVLVRRPATGNGVFPPLGSLLSSIFFRNTQQTVSSSTSTSIATTALANGTADQNQPLNLTLPYQEETSIQPPSATVPVTTSTSPTSGPLYTTGDKWQDKKKQTQIRYFNDLRSVQLRRVNTAFIPDDNPISNSPTSSSPNSNPNFSPNLNPNPTIASDTV